MGYKDVFECEKCDGRPVIKGECQVCGYFHHVTYSDWLDHKIDEVNERGHASLEEKLGMEGFSVVDFEDFGYEDEEEE